MGLTYLNWGIFHKMNPLMTVQPTQNSRGYMFMGYTISAQGGWFHANGHRFASLDDAMREIENELILREAIDTLIHEVFK